MSREPLVFIPAAGLGTRLMGSMFNLAKPLLSIGSKPLLFKIMSSYPENTEFVIATGYQSSFVQQVGNICSKHLKQKVSYTYTDSWQNVEQGLTTTILDSKKKLTRPFIFHAVDSLMTTPLPKFGQHNKDTIFVSQPSISSTYRFILGNNSWGRKHFEAGERESAYIGVSYISNVERFMSRLTESKNSPEGGETLGINLEEAEVIQIGNGAWFDCGIWDGVTLASKSSDSEFIVLPRRDEAIWKIDSNVYKFHIDKTFISSRVERGISLHPFCPKPHKVSENIYRYDFIPGTSLSKSDASTFRKFLTHCRTFWLESPGGVKNSRQNEYLTFYKTKTEKRIGQFLNDNKLEKYKSINLLALNELNGLLKDIDWKSLSNPKLVRCHGDLHHENVVCKENGGFAMLDWRSDMAGYHDSFGDLYYDLAKLLHGLIVSHESVASGNFGVKEESNILIWIRPRKDVQDLLTIFFEFLNEEKIDVKRVLVITSLIYLNIAALHHDKYNRFLFYLGHLMLGNSLYRDNLSFLNDLYEVDGLINIEF